MNARVLVGVALVSCVAHAQIADGAPAPHEAEALVEEPAYRTLETALPAKWRTARVVIDAGHGAEGNRGTVDAFCDDEQMHTKRTQDAVAAWLASKPGVEVKRTRVSDALVSYRARMKEMAAWRADAVIAVHSDARAADGWWRDPESGCWRSRGGNGFAVLYSDEGSAALVKKRRALAEAVASAMIEAGFSAYDGVDYPGLYDPVGAPGSGVFVDRHTPRQRIMMLRRTTVPYVIVETHQAIDANEALDWLMPQTHEAFASALYRAVIRAR